MPGGGRSVLSPPEDDFGVTLIGEVEHPVFRGTVSSVASQTAGAFSLGALRCVFISLRAAFADVEEFFVPPP